MLSLHRIGLARRDVWPSSFFKNFPGTHVQTPPQELGILNGQFKSNSSYERRSKACAMRSFLQILLPGTNQ